MWTNRLYGITKTEKAFQSLQFSVVLPPLLEKFGKQMKLAYFRSPAHQCYHDDVKLCVLAQFVMNVMNLGDHVFVLSLP